MDVGISGYVHSVEGEEEEQDLFSFFCERNVEQGTHIDDFEDLGACVGKRKQGS